MGKIRFSLEELVKDVERQNVLLEYLRLEKLQVCYSLEELDKCQNMHAQAPDDIFNWREIGNYSVCGFHVDLKRRSFKFIFNNYIPCAMFVLVSWVSFLIPPDLIPGR